ncbi:MAG: alkylated DNA repair protein (DNA oxidative demethylase) [Crocinitomicaceae bacterium]|jgi:alkylated DNA repair protein (DNA oxidative demethylase)
MNDLFDDQAPSKQIFEEGITLLKAYADPSLITPAVNRIIEQAPLRNMGTAMGHKMRVSSTCCGELGGYNDKNGYRYLKRDPLSQKPWPEMPREFLQIAANAALESGVANFKPDSALINHYPVGISMGSHQDKEEADFNWPIVSISLGLTATFQVFGKTRSGIRLEIRLEDADVLVLSGAARLYYHGVKAVKPDLLQPNLQHRVNITLRKAR